MISRNTSYSSCSLDRPNHAKRDRRLGTELGSVERKRGLAVLGHLPRALTARSKGLTLISVLGTIVFAANPALPASAAAPSADLATAAPTWSIQSTPTLTGAIGSALSGVSCTTRSACVGVGDFVNGSGAKLALAERWDGTAWSVLPTPIPTGATDSALTGVSCTTAGACAAVGYYTNASGVNMTLVEGWDGSAWSIQTSANPTGGGVLSSVSCGASPCTAVGHSAQNAPLAERWNGTAWVIQPTPAGGILSGVSCTAASACSAVGQNGTLTLAERWNGTAWSIQTTPNPKPTNIIRLSSLLSGVSCTTATACTAVGYWNGWRCNNGKPTCNCFRLPYCTHYIETLVEAWDGATPGRSSRARIPA
jgi:hypothetical protein